MSKSEIERFIGDLKSDEALRTELSSKASGIGSVVEFANSKGYDISADEARDYLKEQTGQELSDDELEALAGGSAAAASGVIITTTVGGGGAMAVISNNSNIASQAVEVADVMAVVGTTTVSVITAT